MSKEIVKHDINFLENPLWFQDDRLYKSCEGGYIWQDCEGYIYRAGYKPPVRTDVIFLLYLLLRSQKENWTDEVEVTRFEILKTCQISPNTHWYERLEDSLERWLMVGVKFQGTFYDGKKYVTKNFHIIETWEIDDKTKKLKIRFSPEFLLQQQHSTFFKLLDFEQLKALRSPLSTRLYEILIKTFQNRSKWSINALKLAEKIPMKEQHPAHIIPKIKTAVNRINECTDFQLKLEVQRPERGKAVFVFHKLQKVKELPPQRVIDVPEEKQEVLPQLLDLVSEEHRQKKGVVEMISKALRRHEEEYVRRNILLSNKHATSSYGGYLRKALKDDWAGDQEEPYKQKIQEPPSSKQPDSPTCRTPTEEEIEAEFQKRLAQMDKVQWEWRMKQARLELAKERAEKDPSINPNKIPEQDAQERLMKTLHSELTRIMSS